MQCGRSENQTHFKVLVCIHFFWINEFCFANYFITKKIGMKSYILKNNLLYVLENSKNPSKFCENDVIFVVFPLKIAQNRQFCWKCQFFSFVKLWEYLHEENSFAYVKIWVVFCFSKYKTSFFHIFYIGSCKKHFILTNLPVKHSKG